VLRCAENRQTFRCGDSDGRLSHIKELIAWRASKTLSCQRETLHSQQLRSIKKSIDSDHGIYRDLRNVVANYPFEKPHRFEGIRPTSGHGDHSRLSCGVGDTQLGRRPGRRHTQIRGGISRAFA
jgi:hypothetical protein